MNSNYSYVIADHIRSSSFIIAEGVEPSGKQRGYILRRLIRRALAASLRLKIDISNPQYFQDLVGSVCGIYDGVYPEVLEAREKIVQTLTKEAEKYQKAIGVGQKEWGKIFQKDLGVTSDQSEFLAQKTWDLYQTFGVPIEVSEDLIEEKGLELNKKALQHLIEEHQKLSQTTSAGQFKSGLGELGEKTTKMHTATHLLHQTLREIFGTNVKQMGSAITSEKSRFDIALDQDLTPENITTIEQEVQKKIDMALTVTKQEMPETEARSLGAIGLFGEKYGDKVTVYTVQDGAQKVYSREFCGGPHVENTAQIGKFHILKAKSIGSGLKRIEFDVA
jgi:alanyl-tRNA synthetase